MNKHLVLLIPIAIFLLIKLMYLGVSVSDSGNYFYTAYYMLSGHMLYKDIFFTDLPFSVIIFAFYFILSLGHFLVFDFMGSIEAAAIACIIYYVAYGKSRDVLVASIAATLYLFSALVFLVSGMTAVFSASLLSIIAYVLIRQKRFVVAGALLGLAIATKGYFLPLAAALLVATYFKYSTKAALRLLASCLITVGIILLPFVLTAGSDMWKDIVTYSGAKERSVPLDYLIWYFLSRDPLLAILLGVSIIRIRRDYFIGLMSLSFILFFLFYQGMQPLYMAMIVPFLCLSLADVYTALIRTFPIARMAAPTVVAIYLCFTLPIWSLGQANIGKIPDIDKLVTSIVREKPNYIYGANAMAPIIAYLSGVPLLKGQIDTDEGLFLKGQLNSHELTKEAVDNKAVFVMSGYQEADTGNFKSVGSMFDMGIIKPPKCRLFDHYQIQGNLVLNQILLIKCY